MGIKYVWGVVAGITIIAAIYGLYHAYTTPDCYDGYGGAHYVEKESFVKVLSSADTLDFIRNLSLAQEGYRCGDTTYLIKKNQEFIEVSNNEFSLFIEGKNASTTLFKVYQSGNSPYFAEDIQTGIKYLINQNDTGYNVEKALRV